MEALILLWVIGYTLWRTSSDTARNSWSLLRGREPQPRQRGAALPASPTARTLGALFGWWWAAFLATWRGSWRDGRARREAGGPWQPWAPFDRPGDPAAGPAPTAPPGPRPAAPTGGGEGQPAAGEPGPRSTGRPHVVPPRTPPAEPAGAAPGPAQPGQPQTEAAPVMEPAGAGDDEVIDGWPTCWSDLSPGEQATVRTYDVDEHAEAWEELTDAQRAGTVARWIRDRFGVEITDVDVLAAQAVRQDPTWRTGVPCAECALYGGRPISANPADHAPGCPVGEFFRAEGASGQAPPPGAPVGWADLAPDAQRAIVAAAEATWAKPWRHLAGYARAKAVAQWLNTTYGGAVSAYDVLDAEVKGDSTWQTGVPCAECAAAGRERRLTSSTSGDHDPDCPSRRFLANREAGYTGWLDQDGYRTDETGTRLADQGDLDTAPPNPGPASAGPVHDPAAIAAGPSSLGGAPAMTTLSGETTSLSKARAYYADLESHASGHIAATHLEPAQARFRELQAQAVSGIAAQIEVSENYFRNAELPDAAVLAGVAAARETALQLGADLDRIGTELAAAFETAMRLSTDARAVLTALDQHRLMEDAVTSTSGVAGRTDFYKQD